MDSLLDRLNPAQREAASHVEGPLLVLAGPGSGKTRVVTHRIAHLLREGVGAGEILALTFTNKAAAEMQARVDQLAPRRKVWISTFHRFGARLLRENASLVGLQPNFTIYDADDSRQTLVRALEAAKIRPAHYSPDRIAAAISAAKNQLITAEQFEPRVGNPLSRIVEDAYPAYQQRLLAASAVDFDDLLLHVATLLYRNPEVRADLDRRYRFVLVDEYQDTNRAQYVMLRALSVDYPNLAVTGDPDQSIYGWRGADLNNILQFESDFPQARVVRLEQNYRSTQAILRVADQLIRGNVRRKHKELYTENAAGSAVRLVQYGNQDDEARSIAVGIATAIAAGRRRPRDFAIFYRINALSRNVERALREVGVPFQIVRGQEFYQRKEIKDVLAYCQLANNPRDDQAFLRAINTPPRGIGRKTLERIEEAAYVAGACLLDAARNAAHIGTLQPRAIKSLAEFVRLADQLAELAHGPVEEILGAVLEKSGYRRSLAESESEEDLNRLANIEELLTDARQFDERNPAGALELYLENAWLVNETDNWDAENDKVTMMTLHAAKGLEFPVVYLIAFEQGLLPHERSLNDDAQYEEERRLAFVGVTRAEQELQLSYAVYRDFRGQRRRTVASPFLLEMPRDEMELVDIGASSWSGDDWDREMAEVVGEDEEVSFDVSQWDEPASGQAAPSPTRGRPPVAESSLTTAAKLAGVEATPASPALPPDLFVLGMTVVHPQHGPGKVVALSGAGKNRQATVQFAAAGERRFVLAHSSLRPVKGVAD